MNYGSIGSDNGLDNVAWTWQASIRSSAKLRPFSLGFNVLSVNKVLFKRHWQRDYFLEYFCSRFPVAWLHDHDNTISVHFAYIQDCRCYTYEYFTNWERWSIDCQLVANAMMWIIYEWQPTVTGIYIYADMKVIIVIQTRRKHDDVIKWNIFRVTGALCGEFTGHRWIPLTTASDAELWYFLWSTPE